MRNKKITLWGALSIGLLMVFSTGCSNHSEQEVQNALDFLYASMPLPDSVDYPREFWEANIRVSLKARQEMPWGKKVPEREWKHFVLPLRVNNENLDFTNMLHMRPLMPAQNRLLLPCNQQLVVVARKAPSLLPHYVP